MKILNEYPPGTVGNTCFSCHASIRPGIQTHDGTPDKVVDIGVHLDGEGHVCICSTCWLEGAGLLGWGPDTSGMGEVNRRLGRSLQAAKAREDRLLASVRELTEVLDDRKTDDLAVN